MRFASSFFLGILAAVCTSEAEAQGSLKNEGQSLLARRPMIGTVLDADSKPLPHADVHCALVSAVDVAAPLVDYVIAKTDERGRFIAKLRPCNAYRIWALGPKSKGGGRLASAMRVAVPSTLLELRADKRVQPRELTVNGLGAWSDRGPFRIRILPGSLDIGVAPIAVGEGGEIRGGGDPKLTIPVLSRSPSYLQLLDRRGRCIASKYYSSSYHRPWNVQPPQPVAMAVHDEQGEPIAGAVIKWRIASGSVRKEGFHSFRQRFDWQEVGVSDAEGKLVVDLSHTDNPFVSPGYRRILYVAEKPGYRARAAGFDRSAFMLGKKTSGAEELSFVLRKAKPFVGHVMLDADTPAAERLLRATFAHRVESEDGRGSSSYGVASTLSTDANGRFEIAGLDDTKQRWTLAIGGGPPPRLTAPGDKQRSRPTADRHLALHALSTKHEEPINIVLANFEPVELTIRAKDGSPASGAAVTLLSCEPTKERAEFDDSTLAVRADQTGRVHLLAEPGKWFLMARTENEYAYRDVTVQGPEKLAIQLESMPTMRGRVVDGDGKPVGGAQVEIQGSSTSALADVDGRLRQIADGCNWGWLQDATSAADGSFALTWLELPGSYFSIRFYKAGQKSETLRTDSKQQDVTVTIQ
ncbi:MAG: hypothetical protein AB8H80_01020 [Planctomycetota bacterium]